MDTDKLRLQIFEFLATPAHVWLWCVATLVGLEFCHGPVEDEEEEEKE